MQDGDVVVMDVAGSYSGYASDITRTLPVNGHFTPRQREIYEIVLGAQNAAMAAAKPGVYVGRHGAKGLNEIAYDYINTHGKDLHGQPLGQYFIHGLSHPIGLNVHDPMDYSRPLEPGMVITMEPGIYIPEEKIGVRIEDDILITPDGNELLTRRLPRRGGNRKVMAGKSRTDTVIRQTERDTESGLSPDAAPAIAFADAIARAAIADPTSRFERKEFTVSMSRLPLRMLRPSGSAGYGSGGRARPHRPSPESAGGARKDHSLRPRALQHS